MTIQEAIKEKLIANGLFDNQADAVVSQMKADPANAEMSNRWNDDTEGYPPQLMAVVWMSARRNALEWIDANCPKAWFRPVFAGG